MFHADLDVVPGGDVSVHAGDLCRGGRLDELQVAVAWLRRQPHRHKIVVAGNHDWCLQREPQQALALLNSDLIYLQDAATVIEGVQFWGSPWQPEYNDRAFNLPRGAALAEKWRLIPNGIDVLITHGPPSGIGDDSGMNERRGCTELLAATQRVQPMLHLFGHIHQDGGLWQHGPTWFANVTTWESERGATVVDLDSDIRMVVPVCIPAADPRQPR
jgi:Icc-related predicted phosphoesterase